MKRCDAFCASECVNGYCPKALAEEYEWYEEMGHEVPNGCRDCWFNTGKCEDCILEESADCPLTNATSCDIIAPSNQGGNQREN